MSVAAPQPQLTTQCWLWRLERRDGMTLGFTSHDRSLEVAGLCYRPSPGMLPSSIRLESGLESDGLDIEGALSGTAISEADLAAGRWDGALLSVYRTSWENPAPVTPILVATLGSISFGRAGFTAELAGPQARLNIPVAPATSPTCRAEFCDAACKLNLRRFQHLAKAASSSGNSIGIAPAAMPAPELLVQGELRWLTGNNCGQSQAIIAQDADAVTLLDHPAAEVAAGDVMLLTEGCDKRLSTCSTRYGNAANFRGEPYLPGNDLLTRYAGAS